MSEVTPEAVKKLKVVDLRSELSKRRLSTKGKKDDLASRLLEAIADENIAERAKDNFETISPDVKEQDGGDSEIQEEYSNEEKMCEETEMEKFDGEKAPSPGPKFAEPSLAIEEEMAVGGAMMDAGDSGSYSCLKDLPSEEEVSFEGGKNEQKRNDEEMEADSCPAVKPAFENVEQPPKDAGCSGGMGNSENNKTFEESTIKAVVSESEKRHSADAASLDENEAPLKSEKKEATLQTEKQSEESKYVRVPELMLEVEDYEKEDLECETDERKVILDSYMADLHFACKSDGLVGRNLTKNDLAFIWCGVKANYGVKSGKVCFECKIVQKLTVDLPETEDPKHCIRIGWSAEGSGLQLGEASLSYGYESSGKICASSNFSDYADPFGEGDVIGAFLDLESEPKTLKYTKNGLDLGIAMSLSVNLEGKALFPHMFIKNMEVEMNFGSRESSWHEVLDGYTFVQDCEMDMLQKRVRPPTSKSECEVIMLTGLPASGKTTWAQIHCRDNQEKHHYIIGNDLVFDRMKLQGQPRKRESESYQRLLEASQLIMAKLLALAPSRKRNYILDQTNVLESVRKAKMECFKEFKRKAVVVVPNFESFRKRINEKKQKQGFEVPFDVLCMMKYLFSLPSEDGLFDVVEFSEQDFSSCQRIIDAYHREGKRDLEQGHQEPQHKRQRNDHGRRDPRHVSGHYDGRHREDRKRYRRRDYSHRGTQNFRDEYQSKSYNAGPYGAGSYGASSYGYGSYSGESYGNSYGQRNVRYGGGSYGSQTYGSSSGQRGMYGGSSYSGNYSQQSASGYRQTSERGKYRQGGGSGNYDQNYSNRGRGSQSGSYGVTGRGFAPRGGGWSQGYGNQQGYNSYQSGQSNFRNYGY